jgi:hypothetical protein
LAIPPSAIASLSDLLWSREDCIRWARHPEAGIRKWALEKLAACFGGIPEAVVAERVDDPDPIVSRLAIEAAVAQGFCFLGERILARYRRGDPFLVATCLQALGKFRVPGLGEAIRARLRAASLEERIATWVSLMACQVPDGEPMLLDAMNRRPPPEPDEMAGILAGLALGGSPEGQRHAVARLVAGYEDLREGLLLDALLPGLGYSGPAEDFLD